MTIDFLDAYFAATGGPEGLYLRGYRRGLDRRHQPQSGGVRKVRAPNFEQSPQALAKAAALRSEGWTYREIGAHLGRDHSGIRLALKRLEACNSGRRAD